VIRDAHVQTAPVTRGALAETVALAGEIAADPDRAARISSPAAGRIERVEFQEGKAVKKGDVLATIRVPELGNLRSVYAATLAKAKAARSNADRLKALLAQRLASEQASIDASAAADALDAEVKASGEQLNATGADAQSTSPDLVLRSPLSGVVLTRDAVVGQPVSTAQVLGSIADLSKVWFLARVFEKDLGRIRVGARADVALNAYAREHFSGSIEYLGQQVDPIARTVTARIRLENRASLLRIGLFGNAQIATGEAGTKPPALLVPDSAVTDLAGKPTIFVRQTDGDFDAHTVVLGNSAAGQTEILSGLRDGEVVVTDGVFTLKSAILKSSLGEE
jgi:cobalt-zinc-cadmium efflux system membrane fusion protein